MSQNTREVTMSQNTGGVTTHAADVRTTGTAVSEGDVPPDDAVLSVRALRVEYEAGRGGAVVPAATGGSGAVHAVAGVDLDLLPGHVTALVGESGSGKSSVVAALTGRWAPGARVDAASATFDGQDLFRTLRRRHGRESIMGRSIAVVPQDPTVSLDPTMRIGAQLEEAYRIGSPAVGPTYPRVPSAELEVAGRREPDEHRSPPRRRSPPSAWTGPSCGSGSIRSNSPGDRDSGY